MMIDRGFQKNEPGQRAGVWKLLEIPKVFQLVQLISNKIFNSKALTSAIIKAIGDPKNKSILEAGCGLGGIEKLLPCAEYVGIDLNSSYIAHCRSNFKGTYEAMSADSLIFKDETFDIIFSIALTHHLTDDSFRCMLRECMRVLKKGGRLIILDRIAAFSRWSIAFLFQKLDRGGHIRTTQEMGGLISEEMKVSSSGDLTVIPVRIRFMECVLFSVQKTQ